MKKGIYKYGKIFREARCRLCSRTFEICHREGYIEADSIEDAKKKLEEEGYTDYLDLVVDDYEIEDADYGNNPFEIKEVNTE